MKKITLVLILLINLYAFTAYADDMAMAGDEAGADNHFSAVNAPACPETLQQSLLEQNSWAAALIPQTDKPGTYQLKLQGVRGHLLYFSEQPFRMGRMNNIAFYEHWIEELKENPKLRVKAYLEGASSSTAQNYILQLSNPSYHGTLVIFDAELLTKVELKKTLHLTDVTLLMQIPECANCTNFPCLSC